MRKMLILLALAILTVSSGCSRCRNLFRRGSPCCGTALAAPAMLGGAIPIGSPMRFQQAPQIVPQTIVAQPGCCEQSIPLCAPCPSDCVPCESGGYIEGNTGYLGDAGADYGCQTGTGEFFGGYVGDNVPPTMVEGTAIPEGSGAYPGPRPAN